MLIRTVKLVKKRGRPFMPKERKPINQNLTVPNALSVLLYFDYPFFSPGTLCRTSWWRRWRFLCSPAFQTVWTALLPAS